MTAAARVSPMMLLRLTVIALTVAALMGCDGPGPPMTSALPADIIQMDQRDFDHEVCRARIMQLAAQPDLGGTPDFDKRRAEILGRAAGEPMVFVKRPDELSANGDERRNPRAWVRRLRARHRNDKAVLRSQLLRNGYVYAEDPHEAFALVRELTLPDLFDEAHIWLARGDSISKLNRKPARFARGAEYRYDAGPQQGRTAKLLFGDRVAVSNSLLDSPLHRDVKALRDGIGFDRIEITHRTEDALLAKLRFGDRWVRALLESDGAKLRLSCVDAPHDERGEIDAFVEANTAQRQAIANLQHTVDELVHERLPFDRPRGVKDHFSDGQLRPRWEWAYKQGHSSFTHEEKSYLVFDRDGRPHPPQMCVELILDSYERASGTWYRNRDQSRERVIGRIDFSADGIVNRAGVLAFEKFAISKPTLFDARRIPATERVPFRQRKRFFGYLVDKADDFQPGDIVAIQGPKADGYVHQHAILVVDVDPLTGMPYALADQMRRPRLRTWEAIMAEAPKRALLYHVRPKPDLLRRLDVGDDAASVTAGL